MDLQIANSTGDQPRLGSSVGQESQKQSAGKCIMIIILIIIINYLIASKLNRQLRYVSAFLNKFSVVNNVLRQLFAVVVRKNLNRVTQTFS